MTLKTIQKTCISHIKSLEILYLLHNVKPAARIMVHDAKIEKYKQLMHELNLQCALSDFKIQKQLATNYSDKGTTTTSNQPGYRFMYIAHDHATIHNLKNLEAQQNHEDLGLALGYPKCCCTFFQHHFTTHSKKSNDYTLLTLNNSQGKTFPYQTNIAARHFDHALISHFPCNFNCKPSIKIANTNKNLLKKEAPELLEEIEKDLKTAVVYNEREGIFLLYRATIKNNIINYNGLKGTKKSELYQKLVNNNQTKEAILFE
tara:strand:+ start:612 stop:1391 length:780 start_codon:yes stop_codon:yes gene_type:complete